MIRFRRLETAWGLPTVLTLPNCLPSLLVFLLRLSEIETLNSARLALDKPFSYLNRSPNFASELKTINNE